MAEGSRNVFARDPAHILGLSSGCWGVADKACTPRRSARAYVGSSPTYLHSYKKFLPALGVFYRKEKAGILRLMLQPIYAVS